MSPHEHSELMTLLLEIKRDINTAIARLERKVGDNSARIKILEDQDLSEKAKRDLNRAFWRGFTSVILSLAAFLGILEVIFNKV